MTLERKRSNASSPENLPFAPHFSILCNKDSIRQQRRSSHSSSKNILWKRSAAQTVTRREPECFIMNSIGWPKPHNEWKPCLYNGYAFPVADPTNYLHYYHSFNGAQWQGMPTEELPYKTKKNHKFLTSCAQTPLLQWLPSLFCEVLIISCPIAIT